MGLSALNTDENKPYKLWLCVRIMQTLFKILSETKENEPVKMGHGEASFVVIRGIKNNKMIFQGG